MNITKATLFLIVFPVFLTGCSLAPSFLNKTPHINNEVEIINNQQNKINELNKKIDDLSDAQHTQEQSIKNLVKIESSQQQIGVITSVDIEPYLSGINKVFCKDSSGWSFGSSVLFDKAKNGFILTNEHVITSTLCEIFIDLDGMPIDNHPYGAYYINSTNFIFKDGLDVIKMKISREMVSSPALEKLNYEITNLRRCPSKLDLNSPVAIVGFPVTTQFQGEYEVSARTVTNGVVSAYRNQHIVGIIHDDYFVTAKVDSGNSGGAAFSKDEKGLCFMGIPTWISSGNYETQGIIQNIQNILKD